ncbi:MAG: hypothetical protein WCB71_08990 [Aestuariivirga sp.]
MNFTLSFTPLLPLIWLSVLGIAGLVLIAVSAFARTRGCWLRGLALALLFASLTNPTLRNEDREALNDIAVAVIDRSQSQLAGERMKQADAAESALKSAAASLGNTELRTITVQSGVNPQEDGTRLFTALNRALADIPPERFAGAILVTDGQVHDVPADAAKSNINGPVHGLLTGSKTERDRRVVIEQAPRFGIVGNAQILRFRVDDMGGDGSPIDVTVKLGTADPQILTVTPGVSTEVPVTLDHGGQNIAEIVAPPMPDEISLENNRAIAVVEGIRDRLRVLLVSGEPHPGERTWRNLLKADASVDLVHFTILRPPEKQDGTPINELALIAFPTRELFVDKIDQFDLVIFDRYHREAVLPEAYIAQISRYVKEGGALLVAAGPEFALQDGLYNTPMADVLAATPTGEVLDGAFRPMITKPGARHPVTAGLAGGETAAPTWGKWFRVVETSAPERDTLMSGLADKPLLVLSRQGEGRSAQLLSDQSWLWARGYDGGGPQTELLRRLAHWLMKEPDLEEEALNGRQLGRELTVTRRTMADTAEAVTVTAPSGAATTVPLTEKTPGLWQGSLKVDEAGMYSLSDGKLQAVAAAAAGDAREAQDILATPAKLAPVTKATGGGIAWLEDGLPRLIKISGDRQMAGAGWLGLKANGAYRVITVNEIPLFASLLALGALLLAFCLMWYREGH